MRPTLTDMRDTVLVALACLVAAPLVLALPAVGVSLCALSLAWLTYRRGPVVAAVVLVAAGAVVAAQSPLEGLLVAAVLAVAGPYAALAMRKRSPWHLVGIVFVAVLAGKVGGLAIEAAALGTDIPGLYRQATQVFLDALVRSSKDAAVSATDMTLLDAAVRELFAQWPGWLIVESALAGLLAVYAVGNQALRAAVADAKRLPSLDKLDLTWHLTWGVIVGLALLAAARFTNQPSGPVAVVGLNVMRVTGSMLVLQGFAVFAGLYRKAGVKSLGRAVGFTVLAITEPLTAVLVPVGLVGLTGLVDLWVNIRKLPRGGEPDTAEELLREPLDDEA